MGLIVDLFAGGGGASLGLERALGRPVDLAINHDHVALAMHRANHPGTRHLCEDIWQVDPVVACQGRPVDVLWASPDCKDHSRAKGGRPRSARVRGLAWMVVRWARAVRPRLVLLENVPEFRDWGPLLDGRRDPARKGKIFNIWIERLRSLGYAIEWRELVACDFGAPTSRKRLFLVARCDGLPVVWPEPTHGPGRTRPWRAAAEIIDWSLPCPSIFLSPEEARKLGVRRPLAENTLRRIAEGVRRFVLEAAEPFIVPIAHYNGRDRAYPADRPLTTVTASPRGGSHAVVVPSLICNTSGHAPRAARSPVATVTTGGHHALVAAFLAQHNGGPRNARLAGREAGEPVSTVTATGSQQGLVMAHCIRHFGQSVGHAAADPVATVTAGGMGKTGLVTSHLTKFYGRSVGADLNGPAPTVTCGSGHLAEVRAFLIKYYGMGVGQGVREPSATVTTKDRLGLVTVHGETYAIDDIGLRMLTPRELYRAQGFGEDYRIDIEVDGRPMTKAQQVEKCGNSVCPDVAEMLARANCGWMADGAREAVG